MAYGLACGGGGGGGGVGGGGGGGGAGAGAGGRGGSGASAGAVLSAGGGWVAVVAVPPTVAKNDTEAGTRKEMHCAGSMSESAENTAI